MERGWGRTLSRASGDTLLRVRHYVFLGPRMHLRTGSGSGEREATAATGPACLASHRPLATASLAGAVHCSEPSALQPKACRAAR